MPIDTSKRPLDGDHTLIVTYQPVNNDGSLGEHLQELQLAWDGPLPASRAALDEEVERHFDANFGIGQDIVRNVQVYR